MKLSVAMTTYNHERFIGQAIESVLAQKVDFDYEILIGDDCSTDGTRTVILNFQRRYPERIKAYLREHNIGAARNLAWTIAACQGQYLALLEGDDYWSCTSKLQKQVDFLDSHPDWAICCARAEVKNEDDMDLSKLRVQTGAIFPARPGSSHPIAQGVSGLLPTAPRAAGTYTLEDLLPENFIPTCTVLYRWDRPPRFPAWFFRSSLGDLPRHALVAGHKKIELLDERMAVYRIHAGGMWSSRERVGQILEHARMLSALSRHLGGHYADILGPIVARSYLEVAMTARQRGRRLETGRHLISCLRNGGLHLGISPRTLAGLAVYSLIGSGYKVLSRANNVGKDA